MHTLRRDDRNVLRKALKFEVKGKRKRGRPKKTWWTQVKKVSENVGFEKEDAMNRTRWRVGVEEIAVRVGQIRPPPFTGLDPHQKWINHFLVDCYYFINVCQFTLMIDHFE